MKNNIIQNHDEDVDEEEDDDDDDDECSSFSSTDYDEDWAEEFPLYSRSSGVQSISSPLVAINEPTRHPNSPTHSHSHVSQWNHGMSESDTDFDSMGLDDDPPRLQWCSLGPSPQSKSVSSTSGSSTPKIHEHAIPSSYSSSSPSVSQYPINNTTLHHDGPPNERVAQPHISLDALLPNKNSNLGRGMGSPLDTLLSPTSVDSCSSSSPAYTPLEAESAAVEGLESGTQRNKDSVLQYFVSTHEGERHLDQYFDTVIDGR